MDIYIDSKGLACPMPVIKLKKALAEYPDLESVFWLQLTDIGGIKDVPAFCQQQGLVCSLLQAHPFIEFKISREE